MKKHYTYIVSYDISEEDKDIIRGKFRDALSQTVKALELSESTYAFNTTDSVPNVKSKIMQLYTTAYQQAGVLRNKDDKVWLICANKKATPNTKKPYEIVCYELVSEI